MTCRVCKDRSPLLQVENPHSKPPRPLFGAAAAAAADKQGLKRGRASLVREGLAGVILLESGGFGVTCLGSLLC